MTKREKIAISISAVTGFVIFCVVLGFASVPIVFMFGYAFGDQTCFVSVEYEKLPYAMGADYSYISPTFFEEQGFELYDTVSIMYRGRWGQYKDSDFKSPIKKSQEYSMCVIKVPEDDYAVMLEIRCDMLDYYDESLYDNTYGNYKYNMNIRTEDYGDGGIMYILDYNICALADSGKMCIIHLKSYSVEGDMDSSQEQSERILRNQMMLECAIDNIVGYSQFTSMQTA